MLRRLRTLLSGLSLTLCAAILVLWALSYRGRTAVRFRAGGVLWEASSARGWLSLDNEPQRTLEFRRADLAGRRREEERKRISDELDALLTQWESWDGAQRQARAAELMRLKLIEADQPAQGAVPPWPWITTPLVARAVPHLVVAATAALPGALLLVPSAIRRRVQRKRGLCRRCAYNLTGNVSGTCPECGERLAAEA